MKGFIYVENSKGQIAKVKIRDVDYFEVNPWNGDRCSIYAVTEFAGTKSGQLMVTDTKENAHRIVKELNEELEALKKNGL